MIHMTIIVYIRNDHVTCVVYFVTLIATDEILFLHKTLLITPCALGCSLFRWIIEKVASKVLNSKGHISKIKQLGCLNMKFHS